MNSFDSIIFRYQDRLNAKHSFVPSYDASIRQKSAESLFRKSPIQNLSTSQSLPPVKNRSNQHLYSNQKQYFQKYKIEPKHDQTSLAMQKYRQTLNLFYEQVNKNKKLLSDINSLEKKIEIAELKIAELEHIRITQKLEYARKLQILNNQHESAFVPNELLKKIEELEEQIWNLRKNEEGYKRLITLLDQKQLQTLSQRRQSQITERTSRERGFTFGNPSPYQHYIQQLNQMSRHQEQHYLSQFKQIKQTLGKLQQQHLTITNENQELHRQISELRSKLIEYKQKAESQQQSSARQAQGSNINRGSYRKGTKRNRTEINQQNIESSATSESDDQKMKNKETSQIETKLKNLERDYEKICSQMLTVESAKKIAKQTSRYYNNKKIR